MGSMRTTQAPSTPSAGFGEKAQGRSVEDMRRLSNLLVGLCAVLFITSFILGAGLLQSDSRISELEGAIMTLDANNLILADQMRQLSAVAVWAPGSGSGDFADVNNHHETTTPPPQETFPPHTTPVLTAPPQPPVETTTLPPTEPPPPTTNPPTTPPPTTMTTSPHNPLGNIPATHTVQPGENLTSISLSFFGDTTRVTRIMEMNGIEDPNHIRIGDVLMLPQY